MFEVEFIKVIFVDLGKVMVMTVVHVMLHEFFIFSCACNLVGFDMTHARRNVSYEFAIFSEDNAHSKLPVL